MSQSRERKIEICAVGMLSALIIANRASVAPAGIPAEPMLANAAIILCLYSSSINNFVF